MALLPPAGFISAAMSAVYSIAHVLHTETNIDYKRESNSYLRGTRGVQARFTKDNGGQYGSEFIADHITLTRHDDHWDNPFIAGGVGINLRPKPDDPDMPKVFGPNLAVEQIESLWIVLRPPFKDCLSKDRINPTLSCFSYELDKYPPHMIALDLPEIEVIVASYLRQSLASGRLHGFLLEETGEFTQLPDTFWRTERGEGALMNEHPLIAQIDGRTAIGYPFVNFEQICDAWKQTYKNKDLPKAISSENTTLGLSPYIGIMIAASNHFGLVNGQLPDGSRVMKDEVERWLDKNWTPDLGEKSPKMISNMATFVRHPDDGRGGNVKSALSNLTRKSIPDRSETERKEIGPDT